MNPTKYTINEKCTLFITAKTLYTGGFTKCNDKTKLLTGSRAGAIVAPSCARIRCKGDPGQSQHGAFSHLNTQPITFTDAFPIQLKSQ